MADEILKRDGNSAVVLGGITDDSNQFIKMIRVDPVTGRVLISNSGAAGFTELPATGTVDGANTVFTFSQTPSYIVSDHAWYKSTNKIGTTNWTGTTTVTMVIPPQEDIYGIA